MMLLAIIATLLAIGWAVITLFANGMRSSPGEFQGGGTIVVGFAVAAVFWLAWAFG